MGGITRLFCTVGLLALLVAGVLVIKKRAVVMSTITEPSFIETTLSRAHQSYLSKRFDLAYSQESVPIAIWEGTNLLTILEWNSQSNVSLLKEDKATLVFLHSRLSALFTEAGDLTNANKHAEQALVWYSSLSANTNMNAESVVKQTLAKDRLVRHGP